MRHPGCVALDDQTQQQPSEAQSVPRSWSRWRIPLSVLVVVSFVGSLALVPRSAHIADLARDLQQGVVTTVDVSPPSGQRWGPTAAIMLGRTFSSQIRWQTNSGQIYEASSGWLTSRPGQVAVGPSVVATAQAAGQVAPRLASLAGGWHAWAARWLPLFLWGLLVALLLAGPQPRRMTKWAVFWLLMTAGGLGALWWLWRDVPWSQAVARANGRRLNGWVTFGLAFVINVALSAVIVAGFHHFFSHNPGGTVQWTVIDHQGRPSLWDVSE